MSATKRAMLARRIAAAAFLIALGNIASRCLGLVRDGVIAASFSRDAEFSAFIAVSAVPTALYDLLINGALSAALVPVFSEYAEHNEPELWRVASTIINLALLAMILLIPLLIWQAPLTATILGGGFDDSLRDTATQMLRWLLPAVFFMGISGLITALLHARQRFLLPSFTTSVYNLGIVLSIALMNSLIGTFSLVAGVLLGALLQVLLQLPGLRGMVYRPILNLQHPGVQRIMRLYAPVALGIGFSIFGIVFDRNLGSRLGAEALATMRYATTLIQLPLGLVVAAVSFAVLPTLSRQATDPDDQPFRATLATGVKVVLLLIMPATAGLAALAQPIIALIFEHGRFAADDTAATTWALLLYLPGLPAAAIDQMLLFAFYARRKTLAPNLVQGAAVGVYIITALGLLQWSELGFGALVLGNSAQWISHAIILFWLSRRIVSLRGLRLGEALLKCMVASAAMAFVTWLLAWVIPGGPFVQCLVAGGVGAGLYLILCILLRVEALDVFIQLIHKRRETLTSHQSNHRI